MINTNLWFSIIPQPVSITPFNHNDFKLNEKTIIITDSKSVKNAELIKELIALTTDLNLEVKEFSSKLEKDNYIKVQMVDNTKIVNKEGYILEISQEGIILSASTPRGIFYGIQTLKQLFPMKSEIKNNKKLEISIPGEIIKDYPRFIWRGFMLDEARHFFGKEIVKKLLDLMASLKFNIFHWHLTDDQGWRIEIKKYPRLVEIGSKRKSTRISLGNIKFDGIPHSGYYSQEDLRDIINYASERFISIIPEIDLPGHTMALLAAYPELSCTGKQLEVSSRFSLHKDVLCMGKEETFEFVQNILNEVINIFPSEVIHVGGDEVLTVRWKKCSNCQSRMREENFESEEELQPYFTNRIASFLIEKDRKLMGWNEILNGTIKNDVICQFWYGPLDNILDFVRKGGKIVMSESDWVYLTFSYKKIPLKKTYEYEPIPSNLEHKFIKNICGIEACFWTELVLNVKELEWYIFPRLIAVAETGWSSKGSKDFDFFKRRLDNYLKRLDILDINYAHRENWDI